MDGFAGRLASILAAVLIIWTYKGLDHNPLLERPLLAEILLLAFTAALAFAASYATKWWPGANGRFDDEHRYRRLGESKKIILPRRPNRLSIVWLIICIVCRLELLRWLQRRLQCAQPGIEPLLPFLLAVYDHYAGSRYPEVNEKDDDDDDDDDHIDNDTFEDFAAWYVKSPIVQDIGALLLALGAFIALQPATKSTVICPASQSKRTVLVMQCVGVLLDATILTLGWRILQWARTSKQRFMQVGTILGSASLVTTAGILAPTLALYTRTSQSQFTETSNLGSLYYFHVLGQSAVLLIVSSALFALQYSPLSSTALITFISGVCATWRKLHLLGTYEQLSKSQVIWGNIVLGIGFFLFMCRNNIRHIFFPRSLLLLATVGLMIGITIHAALESTVLDYHPINQVIYITRLQSDRWRVRDARLSERLPVAATVYMERHEGRKPPPNFDVWWDYAMARDSQIIDHFPQIDSDLKPFWAVKPKKIREEVSKLGEYRGMSIVSIKQGVVAPQPSKETFDDATIAIINDLAELIQPFAKHLPDMDLPVNLLDLPRVLVPLSDSVRVRKQDNPQDETAIPPWEYRQLITQACPGDSRSRSGFYSHNGELCSSCANPQAMDHFLHDVVLGRDICHQPDMFDLHGFFMSQRPVRPFSELVPVFSRSKIDQFRDILIPLSRTQNDYKPPKEKNFTEKASRVFWRGAIGDETVVRPRLLVGGHQERLSHLVNNATAEEHVTMLLVTDGDRTNFKYEHVPLSEADNALKFDTGISQYSTCTNPRCEEAKKEFGIKPTDTDGKELANSRYVLVMDQDDGPPSDFLKVLRSSSIPLVASVFKEWYTDRLFPWLHYIPIDLRFHGLHSTLAYFMGLAGKGLINGRDVQMRTQIEDAKWISEQGKRWANQAIRRDDAEIYMFRLLLEWGRLIDDKRDDLGFELPANSF